MGVTLKVDLEDPEDPALAYAADLIRVGGLVVYPTDTLYGIGANAFSLRAVTAVYEVKRREKNKPLLVLVDSIESLTALVREIPPFAHTMMDAFWPGPMTLVFNTSSRLPETLVKNEKTLAIRIPRNRWCMRLLEKAGCPITATSANISGQPTPKTIDDIQSQLGPAVDLYLDAGELPESKPSTVIDVTGALPRLLREGAISLERIKQIVPDIHS